MKQLFNKTALVMAVLICAATSCKDPFSLDDPKINKGKQSGKNHVQLEDPPFYENSLNSYDYVGGNHNLVLDFFYSDIPAWEGEEVDYPLKSRMAYYYEQNGENPGYGSEMVNLVFDTLKLGEVDSTYYLSMLASIYPAGPALDYATELFYIACSPDDNTNIEAKIDAVKTVEDFIINDGSLASWRKEELLGGASIIRHSAYWNNTHPMPWTVTTTFDQAMWINPWILGAATGFVDFMSYLVAREYNYSILDSAIIAGALSAGGLAALVEWAS